MPFPRQCRVSETLFRASLYLLVIVIPFTTMAIPVITQEFSRSSTPATDTVSSTLTKKEIFDIVFAFLLFLAVFCCLALVGGFPFPPFVVIDWLDGIFRPIWDAVLAFRLRALFRTAADAVVGPDGARAPPQTHDDVTSTTPVPTSHQLPTPNVELDALQTTPRCASSASDDTGSGPTSSSA